MKADTKAIQAIHLTVVTHNTRVSVEHAGNNLWKLVIKNVQKVDAGAYMCQINTDPMKSQVIESSIAILQLLRLSAVSINFVRVFFSYC